MSAQPGAGVEVFAAVDIGASSGRVVAGWFDEVGPHLDIVHRFPNGPTMIDGALRWKVTELYEQVLVGLGRLAERYDRVRSIGIDTWAVDYGLLDDHGQLIAEPTSYRDDRTGPAIAEVDALVSRERQYAVNGLQHLPFTTLYQLRAERHSDQWSRVRHALLLPDLIGYWLSGVARTEITNASTTGLLDATARTWSAELLAALDLPLDLFAPLVEPGTALGPISAAVAERTGLSSGTTVVAVGSHDTASAVVGVPATEHDFAYVSSGTWSLVGLELPAPVQSDAGRDANFTNEGGVDGKIRFLRNVGGLWLFSESLRTWAASGEPSDADALLAAAAQLPAGGPTVDIDAEEFIAPGDMPSRIQAACERAGGLVPRTPVEIVRCVLDSLAVAYAKTLEQARTLAERDVTVVHIVGGGSQNALLCSLTAELTGLPVLAGPVEATALGNLAVQARAAGVLPATLEELRAALAAHLELTLYTP